MIIAPNIHEKTGLGQQLFYQIGNNGPFILWISSLLLLRNKKTYFIFYLIGYIFNILLNQVLKICFKQPRPSIDSKTFDLALKQMKKVNSYANLISYDAVLGMPSGHTQGVFYSTAFVFFVLSQKNPISNLILFFYLSVVLITILQRVYYRFHTVAQIIVGAIIGITYAYIIYLLANKHIKGSLKGRAEEYARF
jgi:membrane-associated phospholipid phosphatase